jgi:Uma2 family endonuclease
MSTMTTLPVEKAFLHPPTDLPEEDGVPLETDWHRVEMNLLIELVTLHKEGREDFFVGGNMFIYFSATQALHHDFRGPDFFYVSEVPLNPPRGSWYVWQEGGRYPDVIIELTSPSTAAADRGVKKDVYERTFRTPEYFIYDPDKQKLLGWRLGENLRYQPIQPNEKGWLWCEQLGLWLGTWTGKFQGKENVYLRFFDKDGNLIATEAERRVAAEKRSSAEKKHTSAEKKRADAEKKRADAAAAELEELKKRLKKPNT